MSSTDRKWTNLERKIRWFFKTCDEYMNLEALELIIEAKWNNEHTKLTFDEGLVKNKYQDIVVLANKLKNLESK